MRWYSICAPYEGVPDSIGRTVRLEVQLRNGKLITVALPKHDALAKNLSPGKLVTLAIGSC